MDTDPAANTHRESVSAEEDRILILKCTKCNIKFRILNETMSGKEPTSLLPSRRVTNHTEVLRIFLALNKIDILLFGETKLNETARDHEVDIL
ncbi:hypothetical protein pdam_00000436 [Pocillopora damicornis]|uniref:Uncharacterized protein n=1 Tax=Pocillopora damicornis TaxID=46731 RepID=A0A3M6UJV9_POCDA|nr:hypothetical protein pdam_00000436 [Pocillopora damicornis]